MTKTSHTPLPWAAYNINNCIQVDIGRHLSGINPCVVHWSGFDGCGLSLKTQAANVAFIVRACNSHYELLEALIEIVDPIEEDCGEPDCPDCQPWRKARAAIAKAKDEA